MKLWLKACFVLQSGVRMRTGTEPFNETGSIFLAWERGSFLATVVHAQRKNTRLLHQSLPSSPGADVAKRSPVGISLLFQATSAEVSRGT